MTFLAKGDVALSITITMCTTLLAPVLTPSLTLVLAGQWIDVNFWNMFISIVSSSCCRSSSVSPYTPRSATA